MGEPTALLFKLVLAVEAIQPEFTKFSLNLAFPAAFSLRWLATESSQLLSGKLVVIT